MLHPPHALVVILLGTAAPAQGAVEVFADPVENNFFGQSVSWIGDVNGDGVTDFAGGTRSDDSAASGAGMVRVYSGADRSVLHTLTGIAVNDQFGHEISDAGDVNADGFDDFIVGAFGLTDSTSRAIVYSGADATPIYTFADQPHPQWFGRAVAGAGDVNGDGFDDFILGSWSAFSDRGFAAVFSGATGLMLHSFEGADFDDRFGEAVAGVGDVNNDGFDDVIIGAFRAGVFGEDPEFPGSATVFSGFDGAILHELVGNTEDGEFGASVCGVGDLDGDGHADFAVGAPREIVDGVTGHVFVYSGATGTEIFRFGDSSSDRLGRSVASGDVNGDGYRDIVVGSPQASVNGNDSGLVRVYSGMNGCVLATLYGESFGDSFGTSISAAGDIDGDGLADLLVGAPGDDDLASNGGSVSLLTGFFSVPPLRIHVGEAAGICFGCAVASAGDVDADGFDDVIVGARLAAPAGIASGRARVHSGTDGSLLFDSIGNSPGDNFGFSVAGLGDVDGDGHDDVAVGAPLDDSNGTNCGRVIVLSGSDGTTLYEWTGDNAFDQFGHAVAGAGDMNADGYDDIAIGAPYADGNGINSGSLIVRSGYDGSELFVVHGDASFDHFGTSVAGAGDTNDDGFADVVGGAPDADGIQLSTGSAKIVSGADGSTLFTKQGSPAGQEFGAVVGPAGDMNRDGFDDFFVSTPGTTATPGTVAVFSGFSGNQMQSFTGSENGLGFGRSAAGGFDYDGDGFDDLAVGAPLADRNGADSGMVEVFSGMSGNSIRAYYGGHPLALFGFAVGAIDDSNGDGFSDLIVGTPGDDCAGSGLGSATVFEFGADTSPGFARTRGMACPGAPGRLPRIDSRGKPRLFSAFDVLLRGGEPDAALTSLAIGDRTTELTLGVLGLDGCTLYVDPFVTLGLGADAQGMSELTLLIPLDPSVVGDQLSFQWFSADSGAPGALPLALSDALDVTIGEL